MHRQMAPCCCWAGCWWRSAGVGRHLPGKMAPGVALVVWQGVCACV